MALKSGLVNIAGFLYIADYEFLANGLCHAERHCYSRRMSLTSASQCQVCYVVFA